MRNRKVIELIDLYDAGRRDHGLQLMVFTAITHFVATGDTAESEDIEDGDFADPEALKNGVEWLRRKLLANHLNAE